MDLNGATRGHSVMVTAPPLQQQGLPGTILYQPRDSPWQPVIAHMPIITTPPAEIPKESIIANTDFKTTSVIAKR
jgi:hypothetical protein